MDKTKVLHGPRTQTYGETNYLKKIQVLDRIKVLHGSRIQTYGETNYLNKNLSFGQSQGIAWSSDSNLWGNQLLKPKYQARPNNTLGTSDDTFDSSEVWSDTSLTPHGHG